MNKKNSKLHRKLKKMKLRHKLLKSVNAASIKILESYGQLPPVLLHSTDTVEIIKLFANKAMYRSEQSNSQWQAYRILEHLQSKIDKSDVDDLRDCLIHYDLNHTSRETFSSVIKNIIKKYENL